MRTLPMITLVPVWPHGRTLIIDRSTRSCYLLIWYRVLKTTNKESEHWHNEIRLLWIFDTLDTVEWNENLLAKFTKPRRPDRFVGKLKIWSKPRNRLSGRHMMDLTQVSDYNCRIWYVSPAQSNPINRQPHRIYSRLNGFDWERFNPICAATTAWIHL